MNTDRIEKKIVLRTTRERVWQALADSSQFGTWFGVKFDEPFAKGKKMIGVVAPTTMDPEVAKGQKRYEGLPFEVTVEQMEAERRFSFRWHPFALDSNVDYSAEPTTLVVFELDEVPGGIQLTVTESGFDSIPLARRATAFKANEGGWGMVIQLLDKYLNRAE